MRRGARTFDEDRNEDAEQREPCQEHSNNRFENHEQREYRQPNQLPKDQKDSENKVPMAPRSPALQLVYVTRTHGLFAERPGLRIASGG
jgi:hypothetical protein